MEEGRVAMTIASVPLVAMTIASVWLLLVTPCSTGEMQGKLLVVLVDGWRWDYVHTYSSSLPNFRLMSQIGARALNLRPDFPSISIPNHYTLMTGVHTQSHDITGNFMYDYSSRAQFQMVTTKEGREGAWWDGAEPLWITAARQGKRMSLFHWRGCEVKIQGLQAHGCLPFTTNVGAGEFDKSVTDSFRLLWNNDTDIAGVYTDIVDITGHWYGPDSPQLAAALRSVDQSLGRLLLEWDHARVQNKTINVMLFSDHGMTRISMDRLINVTDLLTPDLFEVIMESGPIMSVYVTGRDTAKVDKVMSKLPHFHPNMTCYRRQDIPRRWRYRRGRHVAPVTCVADLGWFILHPQQPSMWKRPWDGKLMEGEHGYDPVWPDMWATFYGLGPAFRPGSTVPSLQAVDLYPGMCRLVGLTPHAHDGRGSNLNPLLEPQWTVHSGTAGSVIGLGGIATSFILSMLCALLM